MKTRKITNKSCFIANKHFENSCGLHMHWKKDIVCMDVVSFYSSSSGHHHKMEVHLIIYFLQHKIDFHKKEADLPVLMMMRSHLL